MITTNFYNPTTITSVGSINSVTNEPSISWSFNEVISESSRAMTNKPLYTISGLWMEQFRSVTDQLWCTNLQIPDLERPVLGIEFSLSCLRQARIQDSIIQLTLNNELIGNNYASTVNPVQSDMYTGDLTAPTPLGDYNIYGSSSDTWGTTLTSANLSDPTFGIVISFSSNHVYPHKDLAYINQIGIRITYG